MIAAVTGLQYLAAQALQALVLVIHSAAAPSAQRCPECGYKKPWHAELCRTAPNRKTKAPAKAEAPERIPYLPKLGDALSW